MVDPTQSIVEHEKSVRQLGGECSPEGQGLLGEFAEHALRFSITEETVFNSLAEYLSAKGIGYAMAIFRDEGTSLEVEALFAPNGTNHTAHKKSDTPFRIRLIANLTDDLKKGEVLLMSSVDEVVIDGGEMLHQAFGKDPIMIARLPGDRALESVLILCGKELDDQWKSKAKDLAGKLSSALDTHRLQKDRSEKEINVSWLSTYIKEGHLLINASGDIQDVNQRAIELLGRPREELVSKNILDIIPESKDFLDPCRLGSQVHPSIIELDDPVEGGGLRYLHLTHHPFTTNEGGEALLKISDPTEHWRHGDMIRQVRELSKQKDTDPPVGTFLQDAQGNFIQVNETACKMLGYGLEDLVGMHWTAIVPEDQRYKVHQAYLLRMRGGTGRYEIQLQHKSGRRSDMLVSESPCYANGRYSGTFVFITDLTPLRRAEAIVQRRKWELQIVIDRFVTRYQRVGHAQSAFDLQELLKQAGEELRQMGIACFVAILNPTDSVWNIQYMTSHQGTMKSKGNQQEVDVVSSMHADVKDPPLILLQSGEIIFLEANDHFIENFFSQLALLNPAFKDTIMHPRILAPLKTIDRLFGMLVLCGEGLNSEDIPTIRTFANHISIALEKSRLIATTQVQAKFGQALADIVSALSQEKDIRHLLQSVGERILEEVHLPVCTFSLMEPKGDALSVLMSARGHDSKRCALPALGSSIRLDVSPILEGALRTGRMALLPESCPLFTVKGEHLDQDERCSTLLLPMKVVDKCIGLASFPMNGPERSLTADEEMFLQASIDQLSLAVDELQQAALEDLKAQMDREGSSLMMQILASRDLEEMVQASLGGVANLLDGHFACFAIFNHGAKTAQIVGVLGGDDKTLNVGDIVPLKEWDGITSLLEGSMVHHEIPKVTQSSSSMGARLLHHASKSLLTLPLLDGDEVLGALTIGSQQPHIATRENMDLLSAIQPQLGIALRNVRNHNDTKRHAKQMSALVDLALEISEEMDLRSLLQAAMHHTTQLLDATMGAIFLVEKPTEEITLVAETGLPIPLAVLRLQRGQGLAGKVWEKKGAIVLNKSRNLGDPNWLEACYATGSAIGVPLMREEQVWGVLALFRPGEANRFDLGDIEILSKAADQISVRIDAVEALEKTVRRINQLLVVNDVARRMSTILVEDLLFTEIVRRVAHGLNLDLVILFLVEGEEITEAASYYLPQDIYGIWEPIKVELGQGGLIGWVAVEGQPILVPDVSSDPSYLPKIPIDTRVQSVVGIPLKLKGKVTGILLVGSEKLGAFDQADVDALLALGAHISTCIENARLYEETKEVQQRLAESEKLRALGLVTGGIAHDFNNVLSVILSRAELALKHADDPQVRRHLEQVIASAKEGGETIHRLEGFASVEKEKTDFIGVDINHIAREAIEICRPRWKEQASEEGVGIRIIPELTADQPILGVPSELREVLVNLIFNALEAIPAGGNISVRTENKDNGISLVVSDDGVGMTPEMKQQVLIPFFTTKPGRVGLGLSMCYGILQRHGGTIDIQSEIGNGTTITLWLPIYGKVGWEDDVTESVSFPALMEPAVILIVEDEKSILEGLVETFADAGHKVLSASNGLQGFERFLEAGKLDIVFTDLGLPKLSGWEMIEQLRAFDPNLPIVVFSGWGDVINPMKLRQYGIAKVIRKPFEMAKLHSTLYEVLSMRKKLDPS